MTSTALQPGVPDEPPLTGLAPAPQQLARLLDALLVLSVEGQARVADLAHQVGLGPAVLRKLLSSYMVAAADAVGTDASVTITFGTAAGPLSTSPDDDGEQASADVVYLSRDLDGVALLDELGRRPVLVEQVARALLVARAVLAAGTLDRRQHELLEGLVDKLSAALGATVTVPFDAVTARLRAAVGDRRRVRFRYRDPWTGVQTWPEVEPYDVRRSRTRVFLDAGPDHDERFRSFDVSGIDELEVLQPSAFDVPALPPWPDRGSALDVVMEVPAGSPAYGRLVDGWGATPAERSADGRVRLRFDLDELHASTRLGVLLLQLGPGCTVVSPPELVDAAVPVAERLLATLPPVTAR
jgi:predicted DNA-binding transcriptional regulator YafY